MLLNDYRAWVGLPVHFESSAIDRKKEVKTATDMCVIIVPFNSPALLQRSRRPNNVKMLLEVSPYGWAQFNLPDVATKAALTRQERSQDIEEFGRDDMFVDFMEQDEDGRPIFSADKVEKFLARLGFDITDGKKKKVYRKGTVTYDLLTGRKVVHTGRPVFTYEDVDRFDAFASVSSVHSSQLQQDANDLSSVGQLSLFSSTTNSAATVATKEKKMASSSLMLSDKHNLLGRSKLSKSISGMVTVTCEDLYSIFAEMIRFYSYSIC